MQHERNVWTLEKNYVTPSTSTENARIQSKVTSTSTFAVALQSAEDGEINAKRAPNRERQLLWNYAQKGSDFWITKTSTSARNSPVFARTVVVKTLSVDTLADATKDTISTIIKSSVSISMNAALQRQIYAETEFVGTPPVISYAIVTKDIEPWHRCKFAWISTNAKKLQVYVGGVDA